MEQHTIQNSENTFESVWAIIKENALRQKETDRQMQETDRRIKETDRIVKENAIRMKETDRLFKETDRQMKETSLQMKETDRKFKEMNSLMGSWANNHGSFAEEYFFNAFENGKSNFFGEHFNDIEKNQRIKGINIKDEYDIVMYNDASVVIVEVKYKAHEHDIPKVLDKAKTFKILCPDYKDFRIFLGLASMSFYPELEQKCIDLGIAVIKQVGDKVIINDENLKVF